MEINKDEAPQVGRESVREEGEGEGGSEAALGTSTVNLRHTHRAGGLRTRHSPKEAHTEARGRPRLRQLVGIWDKVCPKCW